MPFDWALNPMPMISKSKCKKVIYYKTARIERGDVGTIIDGRYSKVRETKAIIEIDINSESLSLKKKDEEYSIEAYDENEGDVRIYLKNKRGKLDIILFEITESKIVIHRTKEETIIVRGD